MISSKLLNDVALHTVGKQGERVSRVRVRPDLRREPGVIRFAGISVRGVE